MMETNQPINNPPPRDNRIIWIVVAVVVVLCLCCLVIGVIGAINFFTIRSVETQQEVPIFESTVPVFPDTQIGEPPSGGLGNEILVNDIWNVVAPAAMEQGCDRPIGANSTIEVLQEFEDGVWLEEWTVVCRSGESFAYEVEFIHDDTGVFFNIRPLP
jgi:hypothetical protein